MSVVMTRDDLMAYAEVDYIIHHMNEKYLEKLPEKFLIFFANMKDHTYEVYVDPRKPLEIQGLKKYALEILAILHLKYWCDNEERKIELLNKMKENQEKLEAQMREKYSIDKLFGEPSAKVIKEESDLEKEDFSKPRAVTTYSQYTESNPDIKDYTDLKEEHVESMGENNLIQKTEDKFELLKDIFEKIKSKILSIIDKNKGVG